MTMASVSRRFPGSRLWRSEVKCKLRVSSQGGTTLEIRRIPKVHAYKKMFQIGKQSSLRFQRVLASFDPWTFGSLKMARESAMEEEDSYLMQSGLDTVNYKVWLLRGGCFIVMYVARMVSGNILVEDYTLEFILEDYNRHITEIEGQIKKHERGLVSAKSFRRK